MSARRVIGAVLAGVCSVLALVFPASPASALPELEPCVAQPTLARGSTGPGVSCLQFSLIMMGYPVPYSAIYDERTETAVRWFQATNPPLVADGKAGDDTLRLLGIHASAAIFAPAVVTPAVPAGAAVGATSVRQPCIADAEIAPGERGQSVVCLQRRLIELGHYTGPLTGTHDTPTQQALMRYQKQTPPLRVDGFAGPRTLAALDIWSGLIAADNQPQAGAGVFAAGPFPAPVQNEPRWNLTAEGIPFFGNRGQCTRAEADTIAAEFARDGADSATQQWAVYIASREGGCRFAAVNINPSTRDDSHCTFQLNVLSGTFGPRGELGRRGWTVAAVVSSLQACADAASDLWVYCGRGPWIPPYSCKPPWVGATVNQPPALLPPPPTSVVETPVVETPVVETPVVEPPVAVVPSVPVDTSVTSPPAG
jgi:peptidoglycan hydrolase-like protein with peptidoglycan-binding domain